MFVICLSTEANIQGGKKKVSEEASLPSAPLWQTLPPENI